MSQGRYHYESAFASMLRSHRVPYVGVDEARRTLLPEGDRLGDLKSFDFVVYGGLGNYLVDVKGRRLGSWGLQCWATREDIESLLAWEGLFGAGFAGMLVFMYESVEQPADGAFDEVFEAGGRWYCLRAVRVREYASRMKARSAAWGTVDVPRGAMDEMRVERSMWRAHEKRPAVARGVG